METPKPGAAPNVVQHATPSEAAPVPERQGGPRGTEELIRQNVDGSRRVAPPPSQTYPTPESRR